MNAALWQLLGLQCCGWVRKVWRSLHTVKGALLVVLGLVVFVPWLLSLLMAPQAGAGIPADKLLRFGPAVFLLYCLTTVLFSKGERAIYFTPAEVNFLFPGPFTRRQLLGYKLTANVLFGLPSTLFMSLLFQIHARWYLACFLGLFCAYLFLLLFTVAVNLLAITIGASASTRGRKLLLVALGALVAVALFQAARGAGPGGRALFERIEHTPVWKTIATPLRWFVQLFLVQPGDWLDLARYTALAGGVTLVLVLVVFLLDAHYLEAAATASERIYTQLQRMRRGEAGGLRWSGGSGKVRLSLPSFPWWGGIGPVAWRQTVTALRSLGRLALLVLILGPILAGPLIAESGGDGGHQKEMAPFIVGGVLMYLSLLLTALVPFDFRGDLDRMEVLKALPLSAWRVAVGQLVTPVVLISLVQMLVLAVTQVAWGQLQPLLLAGMAFAPPLNFLVFGLDNLLFLWFPSRVVASNPGDFQMMGRNVLFLFTKVLVVGVAGLLAFGVGLGVYLVAGRSLTAALAAAWLVLAACAAALVPLLALAFNAFDVSHDIPA